MASRYYTQFPEKKLPSNPKPSKSGGQTKSTMGSRAEKSESTLKDSPVGYNMKGIKEKPSSENFNRSTKWPVVKITVDEDYDGE